MYNCFIHWSAYQIRDRIRIGDLVVLDISQTLCMENVFFYFENIFPNILHKHLQIILVCQLIKIDTNMRCKLYSWTGKISVKN